MLETITQIPSSVWINLNHFANQDKFEFIQPTLRCILSRINYPEDIFQPGFRFILE